MDADERREALEDAGLAPEEFILGGTNKWVKKKDTAEKDYLEKSSIMMQMEERSEKADRIFSEDTAIKKEEVNMYNLIIDLEMCNVSRDYRRRSYKYANKSLISVQIVLKDVLYVSHLWYTWVNVGWKEIQ